MERIGRRHVGTDRKERKRKKSLFLWDWSKTTSNKNCRILTCPQSFKLLEPITCQSGPSCQLRAKRGSVLQRRIRNSKKLLWFSNLGMGMSLKYEFSYTEVYQKYYRYNEYYWYIRIFPVYIIEYNEYYLKI